LQVSMQIKKKKKKQIQIIRRTTTHKNFKTKDLIQTFMVRIKLKYLVKTHQVVNFHTLKPNIITERPRST